MTASINSSAPGKEEQLWIINKPSEQIGMYTDSASAVAMGVHFNNLLIKISLTCM